MSNSNTENKYEVSIQCAKNALGDAFIETGIKDVGVLSLEPLSVFVWCDEVYIVKSSNEGYACILDLNGNHVSNRWYWHFQGEHNVKIGEISQAQMKKFINKH
ncbi:hypothetical protein [Photobacterium leiognathi]|uniref:hypothetical protein n=1 Tax=Photobacterium leiognathi TaxID=553611 RepID=UPI0029818408|nr:hypothetical protein [Photobacterium leiognathi]